MNKIKSGKLFPIFAALSAAIIIAGVILFALLGFNTAMDKPKAYDFDVRYDVVLEIDAKEGELEKACEDAFRAQGISYKEKSTSLSVDSETLSDTTDHVLRYVFGSDVSAEKLAAARDAVNAVTIGEAGIRAEYHFAAQSAFGDELWRGALAVAVGIVAALIYVGARFGISSAVAGCACAFNGALFTASFFAVTRIPVFGIAPIFYGAIAGALSLLLYTIVAIKLRENAKDPMNAACSAHERVEKNFAALSKPVLFTALAVAIVIALFGGIAVAGIRQLVLPMLVSVFAAVYSTLLIAPWVYAPIKRAFDRRKSQKSGYVAAKKKTETV